MLLKKFYFPRVVSSSSRLPRPCLFSARQIATFKFYEATIHIYNLKNLIYLMYQLDINKYVFAERLRSDGRSIRDSWRIVSTVIGFFYCVVLVSLDPELCFIWERLYYQLPGSNYSRILHRERFQGSGTRFNFALKTK